MALIRRLTRLFAADVHAVLDQIEEPESVLRQAIREMEEELARQRQREKWIRAEIEAAASRIEALNGDLAETDSNLDLSFANGNEALARRLTRRKLETSRLVEQIAARREALGKQQAEIAEHIAGNADQLEGMRQKAAVLATESPDRNGSASHGVGGIDDDDVEMAYLREKQARMPA